MGVLDFCVIELIKDTFTSPITHIYESDNQQHDHKKFYNRENNSDPQVSKKWRKSETVKGFILLVLLNSTS